MSSERASGGAHQASPQPAPGPSSQPDGNGGTGQDTAGVQDSPKTNDGKDMTLWIVLAVAAAAAVVVAVILLNRKKKQ